MSSNQDSYSIAELYLRCFNNERESTKLDMKKLKMIFIKSYLFQPDFLAPADTQEKSHGTNASEKDRYLKIYKRLLEGAKYRDILELLKKAPDRRATLLLIAGWLAAEGICQPEDIIGVEELQRLAKQTFRFLSGADFSHADRVRAWIPYFERLLRDLHTAKRPSTLLSQGYDRSAIEAASKKRSAIAAACEWLAGRDASMDVDAPTLRNAYSRVYGRRAHPHRLINKG